MPAASGRHDSSRVGTPSHSRQWKMVPPFDAAGTVRPTGSADRARMRVPAPAPDEHVVTSP